MRFLANLLEGILAMFQDPIFNAFMILFALFCLIAGKLIFVIDNRGFGSFLIFAGYIFIALVHISSLL